MHHALSYVSKVKTRFAEEKHIYDAFLEILRKSKEGNTNKDICEQVSELFGEHSDLVEGFSNFLPDSLLA